MCGRYTLTKSGGEIRKELPFVGEAEDLQARFNIAPAQEVPVVTEDRHFSLMKWGLVPSWAQDPSIGHRMINARSESVRTKPAFKASLQRRRCLVPADGFYEWKREDRIRQPYYFRRKEWRLFFFAGLWDEWSAPDGSTMRTFAILTTAANPVVEPVHHRMPVMLDPGQADAWLGSGALSAESLTKLTQPFPETDLEAYPVDRMVNSPALDRPECVAPVCPPPSPPAQPTLF